jgi:hypothetical protein
MRTTSPGLRRRGSDTSGRGHRVDRAGPLGQALLAPPALQHDDDQDREQQEHEREHQQRQGQAGPTRRP